MSNILLVPRGASAHVPAGRDGGFATVYHVFPAPAVPTATQISLSNGATNPEHEKVTSDIVRLGNSIYFVTLGNELVCLDLETGRKIWSFHGASSSDDSCVTCASPAVRQGRVFFGGADGFAYALDAQSGALIWKRDLGSSVTTSAAIKGQSLYLGTAKRHRYRLDAASGAVLADFNTESAPNRRLIVGEDSLFAFIGDGKFVSLDLDLKKVRWVAEASKEWTSARPYLWHEVVLAGSRGELVALRSTDGVKVWSHRFPETVRGIATSPDILYVGTLKGPVFAFGPAP